jgi:glycosyltransferase involved in cell wall biosynthesis
MKILHLCLANYYVDGFGYQENLITKHQKLLGHDVKIVASTETVNSNNQIEYLTPLEYVNEDGIVVVRIPYVNWLPKLVVRKLRIYKGLESELIKFKPDIIFLHDSQFYNVNDIIKFKTKNDVTVYADSHTDLMNSAKNIISKYILHQLIYRSYIKKIEPHVKIFWGVTPSRKNFLSEFYGVEKSKTDLLELGVDDSIIDFNEREKIRKNIRTKLGLRDHDFVIISGGKIVKRKNIHLLMQAVNELSETGLKLVIFGSVGDDIKETFWDLESNNEIQYVGWKKEKEIYDLFFAADIAFFPGSHSVLWEQATGLGLPAVFKYWDGYTHLDLGGNCTFMKSVDVECLKQEILRIYSDKLFFNKMKNIAIKKGKSKFTYSKIAKKSIEIDY